MAYQRHNNQIILHGHTLNEVDTKTTNKTFQAIHTASFEVKGDNIIHSMSLDEPESGDLTYIHTNGLGKVTINDTGWYDVSYKVGHKYKKGGGKKSTNQVKASIIKNNKEELDVSVTWAAKSKRTRNGTNTWRGLLYFIAGDYIELSIQSTGGKKFRSRTQKSVLAITKI